MIMKCTCSSPAQDQFHGPNNRVKNALPKKVGQPQGYRCTVCQVVSYKGEPHAS